MSVENILICTKCNKGYDVVNFIPLQLECKHSQCKKCCEEQIKSAEQIQCLICQKIDKRPLDKIDKNKTTEVILLLPKCAQQNFLKTKYQQSDFTSLKPEEDQTNQTNSDLSQKQQTTIQQRSTSQIQNQQQQQQQINQDQQTLKNIQQPQYNTQTTQPPITQLIQAEQNLQQQYNQPQKQYNSNHLYGQAIAQQQNPLYMQQNLLQQIQQSQQQQQQQQQHLQNFQNQQQQIDYNYQMPQPYGGFQQYQPHPLQQNPYYHQHVLPQQQNNENRGLQSLQNLQEQENQNDNTSDQKQVPLFVGNLNLNTTEQQVKESFEIIAPVSKVKFLKVEATSGNRAAFVSVSKDKVDEVICKMNGKFINGQQCSVVQFKNKNELSNLKVFVRNLPKTFSEMQIWELFKVAGKINSVKLQKNIDGTSRSMGYIVYDTVECAKKAISQLNNYKIQFQDESTVLQVFDVNELKNHRNQVEHQQYDPINPVSNTNQQSLETQMNSIDQILLKTKRPAEEQLNQEPLKLQKIEDPSQYKSIRINFLPEQFNKKNLETLFELINGQEQVVIQQGPKGRYAYINFINTDRAQAALKKFNGMTLHNGIKLQIKPSYPKMVPSDFSVQESGPCSTLFIKYFPVEFSENDIRNLFTKYGQIVDIKINKERVVPMALVQFQNREEAENALNGMKGVELKPGLKLFINWKKDYQPNQQNEQSQFGGGNFQPPPPPPSNQQMNQVQPFLGQTSGLENLQQLGQQGNPFFPLQNVLPNTYFTPSQQNHYNYQ